MLCPMHPPLIVQKQSRIVGHCSFISIGAPDATGNQFSFLVRQEPFNRALLAVTEAAGREHLAIMRSVLARVSIHALR
jgi:hypothetical protein